MSIPTPTTAVVAGTLVESQRDKGKMGLGLMDDPIQPDRTYIVFDAIAGSNTLHLAIGSSTTYSINTGEGKVDVSYTDTGGPKTLTYDTDGRYVITIKGPFAGIDTSQTTTQSELNKYINIVGGSNYPTEIAENAFLDCLNLRNAVFNYVTSIDATAFMDSGLIFGEFPLATSITAGAFFGLTNARILIAGKLLIIGAELDVDGDIICDDLECLNVAATGNVEGATISEGGTQLAAKYGPIPSAVTTTPVTAPSLSNFSTDYSVATQSTKEFILNSRFEFYEIGAISAPTLTFTNAGHANLVGRKFICLFDGTATPCTITGNSPLTIQINVSLGAAERDTDIVINIAAVI